MRLFGKKGGQDENKVKTSFSSYSQTPREQKAAAIAVTVMSLLLTLILCFLVFFSARWIYRSLTNNDQPNETTQTESEVGTDEELNSASEQSDDEENGDVATPAPVAQPAPATPNTGPSIPNTGPESDE